MSSSDLPRIGTPISTTAAAPINSTNVVAPNTPGKPSSGYTYPTRIGAAIAPSRPIDEARPTPGRADIGRKNFGRVGIDARIRAVHEERQQHAGRHDARVAAGERKAQRGDSSQHHVR